MAYELVRATPELGKSAADLNARFAASGHSQYALPIVTEREREDDDVLVRRSFYVVDGDAVVGGVALITHRMVVAGRDLHVANLQAPISAGLVDKRYTAVGPWLMRAVVRENPLMFAVGMGGLHQPFPKLLAAMRWSLREVPFRFRVLRGRRFANGMPRLHQAKGLSVLARTAAGLGVASAATTGSNLLFTLRGDRGGTLIRVPAFGGWADHVWRLQREDVLLCAVRDEPTLNRNYPARANDPVERYRFDDGGESRGWVTLLVTEMRESSYFGNLCIGTILDGGCRPGAEERVVHAAVAMMRARGVDAVIANFSHHRWLDALRTKGFFGAPSNYLFAASPQLEAMIGPASEHALARLHITRGDGDGRIHL